MKQLYALTIISLVLVSCGSKREIAKRESHRQKTERVVISKDTQAVTNDKEVKEVMAETPKSYTSTTENYIETYSSIAQDEMRLYSIPASITLAQGILESGSGNGRLSIEANNHFGIKCHEWTGARIYHDDDKLQECFRKYNDAKYSFRDHSLFLTQRRRYSGLFDLKKDDYKGWAKGLREAGYATDRRYPQKLIDLIERYQLYKFDDGNDNQMVVNEPDEKLEHIVVKGDTLYSISREFNLTIQELQELNGLNSTSIKIGQVLTVRPLPKDY